MSSMRERRRQQHDPEIRVHAHCGLSCNNPAIDPLADRLRGTSNDRRGGDGAANESGHVHAMAVTVKADVARLERRHVEQTSIDERALHALLECRARCSRRQLDHCAHYAALPGRARCRLTTSLARRAAMSIAVTA